MSKYKIDHRSPTCMEKQGATPWNERILILWEEDDARPPGRETSNQAFSRIFHCTLNEQYRTLHRRDIHNEQGDTIMSLFTDGRVCGSSCGLGFVGVVVMER